METLARSPSLHPFSYPSSSILGDSTTSSSKGWLTETLLENLGFPGYSAGKEFACNAEDPGSIPGSGRSPGEGHGYPLLYSDLENSMDCIVHGVTKSQTWLSGFHFHSQKTQSFLETKERVSVKGLFYYLCF